MYLCNALKPLKVKAIAYILHKNSDSSVERPFESGADIYQLDISFNEANTNVSPLCPDTLSATSQAQTIDTAATLLPSAGSMDGRWAASYG